MPNAVAQDQQVQELTTAAEVRGLSAELAEQHLPVRLRGVVTFFSENLFSRFIQDSTAGIYLRESTNIPPLRQGRLVEIVGVTSAGEYAPVVLPQQVRILGEAPLPRAVPTTFQALASGQEDSQFVEISGIVRSTQLDELSGYQVIELATGGGRLAACVPGIPVESPEALIDSTIRVRGVCSTIFNRQRQLFSIRLLVPRPEDVIVETPAPENPFSMPARSIGSLLQFTLQGNYGRRIKVSGTVVFQHPGESLYIQDDNYGLRIQTRQETPLRLGDRVEVLGFIAQGQYSPMLEDAIYRKVGSDPAPVPVDVDIDAALTGAYDCRLVRLEAKLLDRTRQSLEQFFVLASGDFIFHAHLDPMYGPDAVEGLQDGSRVSVTGICLFEPGDLKKRESLRAKSFQLLLRSPADIRVLAAPPWWTLRKLLWTVGLLLLSVLVALAWVGVLRRRVGQQTQIIRQQLQVEASLKDRYVDLFENANDMVFTHDLAGRLTSINRSGERLLQHGRERLLKMSLVDLVAADQQAAAREWLAQVVKGAELPTAEWDFVNASGRRVKLELSSRLLIEPPKEPEVEGIARDITERRRLEHELLEVSNAEQRRIGHDLHDGVCQQLVGIACLLEILGEQMQEANSPQAADVEKIGSLINEATVQARSVARGLFPVRLAESGLVAAIEDLVDNAGTRFRLDCTFNCDSPPSTVDNEMALHLYYVVQEALLNAVKHGKARHVVVSLRPDGERFKLAVRDDGIGFKTASSRRAGMGIRIMRYRANVIGATLDVMSQQGRGTEVVCTFSPARIESQMMHETING
ncbi:MAG: PAS domain-containing sensor histidine kinase [Verrucomicrobia bacterium]|nr:PAS domain-containing sensor histidine kinase [Verrucomicrobiota bacterium]